MKVSSCKKRPDNTKDKNAIKNYGVLTWNVAIITFGDCIWSFPKFLFPLNFWALDLTLNLVNLFRERSLWAEMMGQLLYSAFTFLGVYLLNIRSLMWSISLKLWKEEKRSKTFSLDKTSPILKGTFRKQTNPSMPPNLEKKDFCRAAYLYKENTWIWYI